MPTFNKNIVELARDNRYFRLEIVTNEFSQLVLMSIDPGSEIGEAVHEGDELLGIVEGNGEVVMNRQHSPVQAGSLVVVPAGTRHNLMNRGSAALKLVSVYAPPQEAPRTLHRTREDAAEAEAAAEEDLESRIAFAMVDCSNGHHQLQ